MMKETSDFENKGRTGHCFFFSTRLKNDGLNRLCEKYSNRKHVLKHGGPYKTSIALELCRLPQLLLNPVRYVTNQMNNLH